MALISTVMRHGAVGVDCKVRFELAEHCLNMAEYKAMRVAAALAHPCAPWHLYFLYITAPQWGEEYGGWADFARPAIVCAFFGVLFFAQARKSNPGCRGGALCN